MSERRKYKENKKNYIKLKIKEINDKEIEEEINNGRKAKMINEYNKNYILNRNFEEARAIFMMLTRMIDVKTNFKNKYKNLECDVCKTEENTHHIFKCKKYQDVNEKIKGESIKEVLKNNNENEIAMVTKEIIRRKANENDINTN